MGMVGCKVYYGLENEGSCCYLNAVLQTLFMTEDYRKQVKDMSLDKKDVSYDRIFIEKLKKLFSDLETEKKAVSAKGVRMSLGITDVDEPRDAAEYLQKILEKTPEPSKLFKITTTKRACVSCRDEPCQAFLSLQVSFKDSPEVEDAVKKHVDQMCGQYQMNCHNCKKTTDWKSEVISFPKLLIIQLRRFEEVSGGCGKNVREVIIRPQIKVSSHTYDLYAIVNYEVKDGRRHYYVDIECECRSDWRRFDDRRVSKTPSNETPSDEIPTLRSSEACLLVYRRRE